MDCGQTDSTARIVQCAQRRVEFKLPAIRVLLPYTEIGHLTQNFSPIPRGKNLGHGQLELREYRNQDPKGGEGDDDPAFAGAEGYHEHVEHGREQEKRCRRSE